ncbi:MAG: alpha/beta fold hydrolase, partial [Pseudomonadota bacterium]
MGKGAKPEHLEQLKPGNEEGRPLLCLHGLNQQPNALKYLLNDLRELGLNPYLLHLPGHRLGESCSGLKPKTYQKAHSDAYNYLTDKYGKAPYFLGYSFGGLIGIRYFEKMPFKKMVLMAPALQLRRYTFLLQPALPFISRVTSYSLGDSEYEKKYRFHRDGVPREV